MAVPKAGFEFFVFLLGFDVRSYRCPDLLGYGASLYFGDSLKLLGLFTAKSQSHRLDLIHALVLSRGNEPHVRVGDVEGFIEDLYKRMQLSPESAERLTSDLEEEIVQRQAVAADLRVSMSKKLTELAEERQKLLRAYYDNATPLEVLKMDQNRITVAEEKARAELSVTGGDLALWQEVFRLAIKLADNWHSAYLKAPDQSSPSF